MEGALALQAGMNSDSDLFRATDPMRALIINNRGITKEEHAAALFVIFCILTGFVVLWYSHVIVKLNATAKILAIVVYILIILALCGCGIILLRKK